LYLDWARYSLTILQLIRVKYFFRRFSQEHLRKYLEGATVQAHPKDDVIYLNGRVGVVIHGSVIVKNHPGDNLCKPRSIMKAVEGCILGFAAGENCGGLTCDPLTWMVSSSV
jgi:hypothetical protein